MISVMISLALRSCSRSRFGLAESRKNFASSTSRSPPEPTDANLRSIRNQRWSNGRRRNELCRTIVGDDRVIAIIAVDDH